MRLKHNPNRAKLKGKRVVLVDDSIVRGTTSKKIVEMVRDAGATEVHFRVASPPTTHSCFYGVDTPNTDDLLAHQMDVEGMRRFIGADSLAFISMNGLYRAMGRPARDARAPGFCDACFSGDYPIELTDISGGARDRQLRCSPTSPDDRRCHDQSILRKSASRSSPALRAASAAPPPSRWGARARM